MSTFVVATWNTQWARRGSGRGSRIAARLEAAATDVAVVTEGERELLPVQGWTVDAGGDWGYGPQSSRRKVVVWSRFPLSVDFVGDRGATKGRLVVTTASTPLGPLRIVGVCIPWRDAHVSTGRGDAQPWSEHMHYLDQLADFLPGLSQDRPTVIAGDFNQRVPRVRQPIRVADRLQDVLAEWSIHTAGPLPNGPHIDHIATNPRLVCESVHDWPAADRLGRLSDHAGVVCRLSATEAPRGGKRAATGSVAAQADQALRADPKPDRDVVPDREPAPGGATASPRESGGGLTPDLRAEIEEILRRSSDGLEHGAAFRLREQGLTDAEIAAARGVEAGSNRVWLRSLDALLTGTLPTSKTAAEKNSYGYRELLNHSRSDNLDRYVKAQLRKLQELNPNIRFDPLHTRPYPYRVGNKKAKREKPVGDAPCSLCGTLHAGEC